jgi:small subunit ribosomal protein S8
MFVDPIADLITKIRNAIRVKQPTVTIFTSKFTTAILEILKKEGYINGFEVQKVEGKKNISITTVTILKTISIEQANGGKPRIKKIYSINGIEQISKPGLRIYTQVKDTFKIKNGLGIAIISTSKGLMTDKQVRAKNLGGEYIAKV